MFDRVMGTLCAALACVALAGCGTMRESYPGRTATEQLLISTTADRAIDELSLADCAGKKVFLDVSNLDTQTEKPYVMQRLGDRVLGVGGIVLPDAKGADVVLRLASGARSLDRRDFLVGIPGIPIPIPGAGTFSTPEIAIFKIILQRGKAKLLLDIVDPATNAQLRDEPLAYGRTRTDYLYVLFTGPWEVSDVPESRAESDK